MEEKVTDLMEKMHRVQALLYRYQSYAYRAFGPLGNPMRGQGRVLSILKLQPVISQKELSYLLDMRQQSLSELLAKLERSGYITRASSDEDRRITMVTLTEAGRKEAEKPYEAGGDIGKIFECLDDSEQGQFSDYLDRLTAALEKELDAIGQDGTSFCGPWSHGRSHNTERHGHGGFSHHGSMGRYGFGPHSRQNEEENKS